MCPERCLAYAIPAVQRRVNVHDDPVPAARRVRERVPAPGTGPGSLRLSATCRWATDTTQGLTPKWPALIPCLQRSWTWPLDLGHRS
jgi:hypothetical protein